MACNVLLIDTLSRLRTETGLIFPSVTTGQMCGFLEQAGIGYEVIAALPREDGGLDMLRNSQIVSGGVAEIVREIAPAIVAFFPEPELVAPTLEVQAYLKKILPGAIFCIGTTAGVVRAEDFFRQGFDYICGQDLYAAFINLVRQVQQSQRPQGKILTALPLTSDPDQFPCIAGKFFEHMRPQWCLPDGTTIPFGLINDSQGCTGACEHCPSSSFWGTQWLGMSAGRIFDEMRLQRELLGVGAFRFGGINFMPNACPSTNGCQPHPAALARLRVLEKLLQQHTFDARYISLIRPDTINALKSCAPDCLQILLSRLIICFLGIESFSEQVLDGLHRSITRDMIRSTVQLLEQKNIKIVASFILGSPGETWETLAETESFVLNELPAASIPILNIMTPYPGSRFYEQVDGQGLLREKRLELFDGKHLTFEHPVFKPGELEEWVQDFYYRYFTQQYG